MRSIVGRDARNGHLEASGIEEDIVAENGASTNLADAPAPDDERKPDSPREVTKRSWKYVLRKSFREFIDDQCPDRAASLTYYGVCSGDRLELDAYSGDQFVGAYTGTVSANGRRAEGTWVLYSPEYRAGYETLSATATPTTR